MTIKQENSEQIQSLEAKIEQLTQELQIKDKQLQSAQNLLKQQEYFAFLGQESADIFHDLKNKLGFIMIFTDVSIAQYQYLRRILKQESLNLSMVEDFQPNNSEQKRTLLKLREFLFRLRDEARQTSIIVKEINAYLCRPEKFFSPKIEIVEINFNDTVDKCLKSTCFYGEIKKQKNGKRKIQLNLETDYDSSIGKLSLPAIIIERILINIIDNAYYAVYEKKDEIGKDYIPTISIKTELIDRAIKIIIKDNGKGIPPEVIKKCAHPFFTTKSLSEGTGLGLNIVTRLIERIKGKITIESSENEYTQFTLSFPISQS